MDDARVDGFDRAEGIWSRCSAASSAASASDMAEGFFCSVGAAPDLLRNENLGRGAKLFRMF
jgi:hypothetical protein